MANNLEERLNALKGKQDNVGDQFGSDDIRTLVEGIEYAMSHGGTVSVTITALEDGSGYKITIIDSEGGAHEATLKNGGDAYEVYKSTVPEGQSPMTKEEWLETLKGADGADGQDGADGAPGHNPNLGTFLDTDTDKPTTGQTGDYFIVIDTSVTPRTASVWAWNGTTFANTEKSVENFGVQFASGQPVANVHIKDENGKEVTGPADVLSADALEVSVESDGRGDLDISDERGNVLIRFKNGHIKTKNFNSETDTPCREGESTADLSFSDNNGHDIVRFKNGHIKTKNFNSEEAGTIKKVLKGKKISILGDSISTAKDNNAVQYTILASDISNGRTLSAFPTCYDINKIIGGTQITSSMVGVLTNFTPMSGDEGKTIGQPLNYNNLLSNQLWWGILAAQTGATILQNVSWSGASMSSHEGNTNIYKTSYAWHDAQIAKLASRDANGNIITPDVVIVYRGTNDLSHSPYSKLTDFGAANTSIPNNDSVDGGYGFKEAYALTIKKIRETYPNAEIICCTLNVFKRINYSEFPTNNGTNTLPQFNNAIREVANQMGCHVIEFDKDGITFENCYPTYISDSATIPTHPNATGHEKMAKCAIATINKIYNY